MNKSHFMKKYLYFSPFFSLYSHMFPIISFLFSFVLFRFFFLYESTNSCHTVHVTLSKNENITDFYVEANIDGMHKGVFRSDTPVNWHRKHKQHHSSYNGDHTQAKDDFSNHKVFANQFMGSNNISMMMAPSSSSTSSMSSSSSSSFMAKKIRVDESGIEVTASIPTNSILALNSSTSIGRRNKRLKMSNHIADHCTQEFWSENVNPGSRTTQFTRRWSYSKADLINKTVSFRCVQNFFFYLTPFTSIFLSVFYSLNK